MCYAARSRSRSSLSTIVCLPLLALIGLSPFAVSEAAPQSATTLEQQLRAIDAARLAIDTRRRGDPKRGAMIFYTSAAGCAKCHQGAEQSSALAPNLATLVSRFGKPVTDEHLIESLLYPSRSIRHGYETIQLMTDSGQSVNGILVRETADEMILRDAANLEQEISVAKDEIEAKKVSTQSMMPDGLIATLPTQRDFFDLASYLFAVVQGGPDRAAELMPTPEQMIPKDDTQSLDHAGIWRQITRGKKTFSSGQDTFKSLCASCHGLDGNTPSLATARAFGKQPLKFGSDPYRMFMTLSRGNGLMAATTYLSPRERYEVVYFIREQFMKGNNPGYEAVTDEYLAGLPVGTGQGELELDGPRDYGPALASQLGRDVSSALTVKLGSLTIAYNLHTLEPAAVWQGGFLDLDQTQHQRGRGEGYPQPDGKLIDALAGWQWAHDDSFDYDRVPLLPRGPLPKQWLDYHGHYLHGEQLVLSYRLNGREVLELPSQFENVRGIHRYFKIAAGPELMLSTGSNRNIVSRVLGDIDGIESKPDNKNRRVVRIPAGDKPRVIEIVTVLTGDDAAIKKLNDLKPSGIDPASLTMGGPAHWSQTIDTVGYPGLESSAYVLDTVSVPEETPWNSWLRTTALDFFPDGRMVVTTHGGDVWIVSGVDEELLNVKWKRFAGGLYEPFGVKVVDDKIYVICKDRLTRLHDLNQDGEADFYESFFADPDVSTFFHAFNFDLHTDRAGNFYYAKAGQYTSYALPGSVMKISPDGKEESVFCTGFRTPNGMGMMPDDRMTVSDNQGNWMPASKISLVKPGGFYGYVQNKSGGKGWSPDGGRIDHTKVVPPRTFDQPIIWMPQDLDNSSGGQIWVDDPRFGPLAGHLLHTSFGKGWLYYLMMQEVGDVSQAAIVKLPYDFNTGIMRGRVNPIDGQVYVTGLNGWNENGRQGLRENGVQRLRYTGKPSRLISDCQVATDGLVISFNFQIDKESVTTASFEATQWNYLWSGNYGSEQYKPHSNEVGTERIKITAVEVSQDGKSLKLLVPGLQPVNQMHLRIAIADQAGEPFAEEVYWTINRVP